MAQDYDYMDGGEGQMFHDFYNNYEDGEVVVVCPCCERDFSIEGDEEQVECPYCGELINLEDLGL